MRGLPFILFWAVLYSSTLNAKTITLSVENWHFDQTRTENLKLQFASTGNGLTAKASAEKIALPGPLKQLTNVRLNCNSLTQEQGIFGCKQGNISFDQQEIGNQQLSFTIRVDNKQNYQLGLKGIDLANSQLQFNLSMQDDNWNATVQSAHASLSSLLDFFKPYMGDSLQQQLASWQLEDRSSFTLVLLGNKQTIHHADLQVKIKSLNANDEQGLYTGESVNAQLAVELWKQKAAWQWQADLNFTGGQAYIDPVFFDFAENGFKLNSSGYWQQDQDSYHINELTFIHDKVLAGKAEVTVEDKAISSLTVGIERTDADVLYQHWLQPFTVGTAVDDVQFEGDIAFDYQQLNNDKQFSLKAFNLSVQDLMERFSMTDLTGGFSWTSFNQVIQSELSWQKAKLYALPIGQSTIKLQVNNGELELIDDWQVPILDGELKIDSFVLDHKNESTNWTFNGLLTPISMESLSERLGWPLLHGKLSGVIPQVSYHKKQIEIDGALMVKLFDGTAIFRDLRLERPFDTLPQLYGNIDLSGLDLETITRTFEFGKITGKLDGKVKDLRLSNWQPVHFDASISTPENDKSRRRISQQAIDNLSQIGGGVTGLLSKSFLRFFEDFSYQKIGLSCNLRNEVCTMSGVEETDKGYYIVIGGGLPPRIHVVGYTRRVDWPELIGRLKAVSQSSGAVVK